MNYSLTDRATVLVEALPYIQKYNKKTIVVKYGGNAMISDELRRAVICDIVLLSLVGIRVVVVHGGGPEISEALKKLGIASRFVNGLRYTDEETMDVVKMVLCGRVNKDLAAMINSQGGRALGLCGLDAGLIQARKMSEELGLVGEITEIRPEVVNDALDKGYIPVIASVAQGEDCSYNINADTAASHIATKLNAEKLILLTDVRGVLKDPKDENTLLPVVRVEEVPLLVREGVITGGMIPKTECCVEAVRRGVRSATILDGRVPHAILMEMFTDAGIGTMIV